MKMSKRIGVVSVCVALICALAACNLADMEFGGLVGELLNGSGPDGVIEQQPPSIEETDGWFDRTDVDIDVQPGGISGQLPGQIVVKGDQIIIYETDGTSQLKDTQAEILRESQLEMEKYVADQYGIDMAHKVANAATMLEVVQNDVQAGSGVNYMCYLPLSQIGKISTSGLFYSNHELPLELNNGCWFNGFNADLCIGDRQFAFAGYLTPYVQLNVDVLVYNSQLLEDFAFNVYDSYYSGEWTLETLYKLSKQMYVDLNGNGQMDTEDMYAVLYPENFADHIFYGSGMDLFDNGAIYVHPDAEYFELCDLANKIRETSLHAFAFEAEALFLEGRAAFYATTLADFAGFDGGEPMVTYADFATGVVPTPYYSTAGGYASHVDPNTTPVLAVPYCAAGEIDVAINALSVLAGQYYAPAAQTWLYKVCSSPEALDLAQRAMDNVSCDVDCIMLGALGYNCNPVEVSDPASYLAQYGKQFEKELVAIYRKAEKQ